MNTESNDVLLPEWATGLAHGEFQVGAHLATKDGRRMGNAFIYDKAVLRDEPVYLVITDATNQMTMTQNELEECFYPPEWVSDVTSTMQFILSRVPRTPEAVLDIVQAANNLYTDLNMLEDGSWQPDPASIDASLESLETMIKYLGIKLADTREDVKE